MPSARDFFTQQEQAQIVEAIRQAELHTSGEIRLHVENRCWFDPVKKASRVFDQLGMSATRERNGILFYLAVKSRKLALIGDKGIHEKVGSAYWNELSNRLLAQIKNGHASDGLAAAILDCGKSLGQHFPLQHDDTNELSNDISFK